MDSVSVRIQDLAMIDQVIVLARLAGVLLVGVGHHVHRHLVLLGEAVDGRDGGTDVLGLVHPLGPG